MKVVVLYHPVSDHARRVEEFAHDYARQTASTVDLISLETKDGAAMAKTYDVVSYPAILVMRETGELLQFWQGDQLPLIREVAAQAGSQLKKTQQIVIVTNTIQQIPFEQLSTVITKSEGSGKKSLRPIRTRRRSQR